MKQNGMTKSYIHFLILWDSPHNYNAMRPKLHCHWDVKILYMGQNQHSAPQRWHVLWVNDTKKVIYRHQHYWRRLADGVRVFQEGDRQEVQPFIGSQKYSCRIFWSMFNLFNASIFLDQVDTSKYIKKIHTDLLDSKQPYYFKKPVGSITLWEHKWFRVPLHKAITNGHQSVPQMRPISCPTFLIRDTNSSMYIKSFIVPGYLHAFL